MHIESWKHVGWAVACALMLSVVGTACSGDDGNNDDAQECPDRGGEIEVAGTWTTNFGSTLEITSDTWTSIGNMTTENPIASYDNCENRVVYGADSNFSKIVWTEPSGGEFYYCTVAFEEESAEAARQAEVNADLENPEQEGSCGEGFAFTRATEGSTSPDAGMTDAAMGDSGS